MPFRIPRGYEVNRPQYQELSEGIRPQASMVPMEAWTGLPPVRVDDVHDDPIVIDPGTIVGIASGGLASGKIFPAHQVSGASGIALYSDSTDATKWGLFGGNVTITSTTLTNGGVKPLGVVYQPIYSFYLQQLYTNYKRNENMGFVTQYMIQIPAITTQERALNPGDIVMVTKQPPLGTAGIFEYANEYGRTASLSSPDKLIGRYQRWDQTADSQPYIVGRVLQKIRFAQGTANTLFTSDTASTLALTTAGQAEFKGLDKVQTVPGLGLAGSGTKGVPSWLTKARSDGSGFYYALTILLRL